MAQSSSVNQFVLSIDSLVEPRAQELAKKYGLTLGDLVSSIKPKKKNTAKPGLSPDIINPYFNMIRLYAAYAAMNFELARRRREGVQQVLFSAEDGLVLLFHNERYYEGYGEYAMYHLGYYIERQNEFISQNLGMNK